MILPFPKKGSILAQSSVLVLVTIQLCSRGARGTGQVPTAEQQIQCHIVCSAGSPWDTLPLPGQRVGCLVQQEASVHDSLAGNMQQGSKILWEHFRLLFARLSVTFLKGKSDLCVVPSLRTILTPVVPFGKDMRSSSRQMWMDLVTV